jgi:hypothetical protein
VFEHEHDCNAAGAVSSNAAGAVSVLK